MKKLFCLLVLAVAFVATVSRSSAANPSLSPPAPAVVAAAASVASYDHVNVDAFGSYRPNNGKFGEGLGVSYFVNRVIGLGLEAQFDGVDRGKFPNDVNLAADVIFRSPIRVLNVRPYLFGGGGRSIGPADWEVHAGAGGDLLLAKNLALFGDWRVYADPNNFRVDDSLLRQQQIRVGLRLLF